MKHLRTAAVLAAALAVPAVCALTPEAAPADADDTSAFSAGPHSARRRLSLHANVDEGLAWSSHVFLGIAALVFIAGGLPLRGSGIPFLAFTVSDRLQTPPMKFLL